MAYRQILFDADNTILDFDACESHALERLFRERGLPFDEAAASVYHETNEGLWRALERGELTQEELLDTRFALAFRRLGVRGDGREAEARYRELLGEGAFLMPGALAVCGQLAKTHPLWVVTNGISDTQRRRLAASGLDRCFRGLFISGEMGVQKPQREYFDRVLEAIGRPDPSEVLLVGDSLTSDIRGGNEAGIPTCWYNPRGAANPGPWSPHHEIRDLSELFALPGLEAAREVTA